ncbi:MAG: YpdA family putative bacillithiol disulfide reductase [Vicinamibacteria bacterium]|nr:YpdA family putative bacillithiol disulfide reductase [Vicinamibacteria bacterium]
MSVRDLIIVGAGPSGLATAIAAGQAGLDYTILEKGVLVNSIYQFPVHMSFFTTPELLEIGGLPLVTPYEKPTRIEALKYYRRVAEKFDLRIEFGRQVTGLDRDAATGVLTVTSTSSAGTRTDRARAVVFAIGYYDHPNRLGVPGEDLPHVSHYYRDAHSCYRQRVVVVGGKNSAAEAALELFRAGAHVTLVHRRSTLGASIKYWVKPDIDNRIAEGSIPARFNTRVVAITPEAVIVDPPESLPADRVFLLTGYHADFTLLEACGLSIDPDTGVPAYDPGTLESNVPNVFLAGGVLAGKDTAPIFIENGRFHGERLVKVLADRLQAASATR